MADELIEIIDGETDVAFVLRFHGGISVDETWMIVARRDGRCEWRSAAGRTELPVRKDDIRWMLETNGFWSLRNRHGWTSHAILFLITLADAEHGRAHELRIEDPQQMGGWAPSLPHIALIHAVRALVGAKRLAFLDRDMAKPPEPGEEI